MTQTWTAADAQPLVNCRDLGGTAVAGGRIHDDMLWRADDPTLSPREEINELKSRGLSAVLDLRSTSEVDAAPHFMASELGVMAHHLPLAEAAVNPLALAEAAPTMRSPRDVGRWYAGLVRSHSHEVAEGLRIISATEGGTLFHCAAGKDRTGILAAIVLTLLGADQDLIVADYAQTQQNLRAIFARLHKAPYSQPPAESDDAARQAAERAADFFSSNHPLLAAAPESMEAMLEDLGGAPGVMDLLAREADVTTIVEDLQIKLVG